MGGSNMNYTKEYQRLILVFVLLIGVNFLLFFFISGTMMITLDTIILMNDGYEFLDGVARLPFTPPASVVIYSMLSLLCIFLISYYRHSRRIVLNISELLFVIQLMMSFVLMYVIGFSSNMIILLIVADILLLYRSAREGAFLLVVCALAFIITSMGNMNIFSSIPFESYISVYNTSTQFILKGVLAALETGVLVVFIVFSFLLIQLEVHESSNVKELNSELISLNNQLKEYANIREKMGETRERNRLAREIHDTLGHTLTGLSVGLNAVMMIPNKDDELVQRQLIRLSETAQQGLKDVRRSVKKLRPDALETHSLKGALGILIQDFCAVSSTEINFVCHLEELRFSPDEEDVVYRVIQESLTNAIRHGKANKVFISFALENERLIIIIEDDGIGCKEVKPGFGLHHMQERIKLLSGTLRFYGHAGFVIIAEIPIRKELVYG